MLARETVVMENLKKESEEELEEGEVREYTAVIVVEESVRVKAEKTEVKENIFVKDEVLIEDTLVENVTEVTCKKDAGRVQDLKEKPYPCNLPACDKQFGNKCTLKAHIRKLHLNDFESSEDLERQIRAIDSQEKPYPCKDPGCGQRFGVRGNLKTHIRIVHSRERPYQCKESSCDKTFSMKSGLKVHIGTVHLV